MINDLEREILRLAERSEGNAKLAITMLGLKNMGVDVTNPEGINIHWEMIDGKMVPNINIEFFDFR